MLDAQTGLANKSHWTPARIACVVDIDNLCNKGINRHTGLREPQAELDMSKLGRALYFRGVRRGTACRNLFLPAAAEAWRATGLELIATHCNCDATVISVAIDYVLDGLDWVILISGDSDYLQLVAAVQATGTRVEIWANKFKASKKLLLKADRVRFINDLYLDRQQTARPATPVEANDNRSAVFAA